MVMENKDYLDVPKPNFIVLEDLMVQSGKDIRIAALGIACQDTCNGCCITVDPLSTKLVWPVL